MARHAKLEKGIVPDPGKTPFQFKNRFKERFLFPLFRFFNVGDDFPLLKKLSGAVLSFVVFFLIGTLFIPFQYYLGWLPVNADDFELVALSSPSNQDPLATLITEDGFMIKPALQTIAGDRSTANQIFRYAVEPGDTLSAIAQQFGIKKETLIMENELWEATSLPVGTALKVLPVDGVSHSVKKGETLSGIAKKYTVEAKEITRQNQLEEGAALTEGQILIIPGGRKERPVVVAPSPPPSRRVGGRTAPVLPPEGAPRSSSGRLIWPTNSCGKLTQRFSWTHNGLDIACRAKGPIFAAAAGKVVTAGFNRGGYGNYIILDHGGGMQTLYGHNETLYVKVGEQVSQGQTIAWMGNTGNVRGITGIHVHFEVQINKVRHNPFNFL